MEYRELLRRQEKHRWRIMLMQGKWSEGDTAVDWYISRVECQRREGKIMCKYVPDDWVAVNYET